MSNTDEDFSDSSRYPQPGSRPVTTGGARPVTSRLRPVTSLASRPGTAAMMPDWMFSEEQEGGGGQVMDRPKTGYIKVRLDCVYTKDTPAGFSFQTISFRRREARLEERDPSPADQ